MFFQICPKLLWLYLNKPEEAIEAADAQKHIDDGIEVGKYAKQFFPNTVDTTTYKEDGSLDIDNMIGLTNRYLVEEKERIRDGLLKYCCLDTLAMVKVLKKVKEAAKPN